jgi:hypothetical protein
MAQYVDFTYYSTNFGGVTIPEANFAKYERKSRAFINDVTFNRLQDDATLITDTVKECLCEIMESNFKIDQKELETDGKLISSESVDGHTETYAISDVEKNEVDKSRINFTKFYNIARQYLGNTGLLYRGL